jgi:hypothetical protein
MAKSVLYMSMSLDGFITGPDDGPGNGLGNSGHRLHEWLGEPVSEHPHFDPPGLILLTSVSMDGFTGRPDRTIDWPTPSTGR